jgi:hypothetical protein
MHAPQSGVYRTLLYLGDFLKTQTVLTHQKDLFLLAGHGIQQLSKADLQLSGGDHGLRFFAAAGLFGQFAIIG